MAGVGVGVVGVVSEEEEAGRVEEKEEDEEDDEEEKLDNTLPDDNPSKNHMPSL